MVCEAEKRQYALLVVKTILPSSKSIQISSWIKLSLAADEAIQEPHSVSE